MYLLELGPIIYQPKGGGTFTLPKALDELRGVHGARILRADDLTVAVLDAGDVTPGHARPARQPADDRRPVEATWRPVFGDSDRVARLPASD